MRSTWSFFKVEAADHRSKPIPFTATSLIQPVKFILLENGASCICAFGIKNWIMNIYCWVHGLSFTNQSSLLLLTFKFDGSNAPPMTKDTLSLGAFLNNENTIEDTAFDLL